MLGFIAMPKIYGNFQPSAYLILVNRNGQRFQPLILKVALILLSYFCYNGDKLFFRANSSGIAPSGTFNPPVHLLAEFYRQGDTGGAGFTLRHPDGCPSS
jgi:hypothetical protein